MTDPRDAELEAFITKFVDWKPCEFIKDFTGKTLPQYPPRWLVDLNAWHSQVWPKINHQSALRGMWADEMMFMGCWGDDPSRVSVVMNANAKSRCLALYRALEGKLPEVTT